MALFLRALPGEGLVRECARKHAGEIRRIAGLAVEGMLRPQGFDGAPYAGRNHRKPDRHGFQDHERQPLEERRQHQQVRGSEQVADVVTQSQKVDALEPEGGHLRLARRPPLAFPHQRQPHRPALVAQEGTGVQKRSVILLRRKARNAEEKRAQRDPEPLAYLAPRKPSGRRQHPVRDGGKPRPRPKPGQRRPPGRGGGVGHRDERIDARRRAGVVLLLPGIGDEPRQMLGPHHRRSCCATLKRQALTLPADAGMDMQHVRSPLRQEGPEARRVVGVDRDRVEPGRPRPRGKGRTDPGFREGDDDAVVPGEASRQRQHVMADPGRIAAVGREDDPETLAIHRRPSPPPCPAPPAADGSPGRGPRPGPCLNTGRCRGARRRSSRTVSAPAPRIDGRAPGSRRAAPDRRDRPPPWRIRRKSRSSDAPDRSGACIR